MIDPEGFTVGYSRDGLASIGTREKADTHVNAGAWVRYEDRYMTYDEAKALTDDVNAGIRAAKAAAQTCETCGRVLP